MDKMKKKVFISIPMNGRSDEEIKQDMNSIMKTYFPTYEMIESFCEEEEDCAVKYLGRSIYDLGKADLVVFVPGWKEARGCVVENITCQLYDIPVLYLKDDWRSIIIK